MGIIFTDNQHVYTSPMTAQQMRKYCHHEFEAYYL